MAPPGKLNQLTQEYHRPDESPSEAGKHSRGALYGIVAGEWASPTEYIHSFKK